MTTKSNTTKTVETKKVADPVIDMTKYAALPSKSAKIRAMGADGFKAGPISRALNIRFQHARNVLTTPVKKQA
jgi:hypothetical protein